MSIAKPDPRIEGIFAAINKRKSTFGKSKICLAIIKADLNTWLLGYGLVTYIAKGAPEESSQQFDYGNFVLIKQFVEIDESIDFLRLILEKGTLKLKNFPEIPVKVSFFGLDSFPSGKRGYSQMQWPMLYGSRSIENTGSMPGSALSKLGLPLYPNGYEAVADFFDLPYVADRWNFNNFDISVPDFRARITTLRLRGKRVTLEVEAKTINESDLRAKFFCKNENNTFISGDLPIKNGQASFEPNEETFIVNATMLSLVDGDTIDWRSHDYRYLPKEDGVILEDSDLQLMDIISKGENETVEFKSTLEPQSQRQFIETVVSFANTNGGTIFIGVDDNAVIKGFSGDAKAQILDLVQGNCEPTINVQIRSTQIGEHQILIVDVPGGENKPYFYSNRGIFVRRGSSDRQINRMELDELYAKKSQSYPGATVSLTGA
jgi:hypothetical protein